MRYLWIAVAGAAGALARYGISGAVARPEAGTLPTGTLIVNLTGSFLLGLLVVLLAGARDEHRLAVTVGFLGSYTTFSTFSVETLRLMEAGAVWTAAAYVALSVLGGIAGAWLGMLLARA